MLSIKKGTFLTLLFSLNILRSSIGAPIDAINTQDKESCTGCYETTPFDINKYDMDMDDYDFDSVHYEDKDYPNYDKMDAYTTVPMNNSNNSLGISGRNTSYPINYNTNGTTDGTRQDITEDSFLISTIELISIREKLEYSDIPNWVLFTPVYIFLYLCFSVYWESELFPKVKIIQEQLRKRNRAEGASTTQKFLNNTSIVCLWTLVITPVIPYVLN